MRTLASMRSASLGVAPVSGFRVMSLTEKIPNCMSTAFNRCVDNYSTEYMTTHVSPAARGRRRCAGLEAAGPAEVVAQPGRVQQTRDRRRPVDQRQRRVLTPRGALDAQEPRQPDGIDEGHRAKVEHELAPPVPLQLAAPLVELANGREIDLAGNLHHNSSAVGLDLQPECGLSNDVRHLSAPLTSKRNKTHPL